VPFTAGDGFGCNLINVRGSAAPTKGPVLLVHGAGVRANIFRAPVRTSLVDFLVQRGYDIWLENWRASIDLPPNEWTLDQAAIFDHPAAVRTVLEQTGASTLQAVVHCQGSTSFMMSAVAGLLPQVTTILSNAVSLHPVVPRLSALKLRVAVPLVRQFTPYLDCQWGVSSPTLTAKLITAFVKLTHHECDNTVCRYASFTYGTGFPTLWRHENLNTATHDWITGEFAHVPLTFFRQMSRSVARGRLVPVEGHPQLPENLVAEPPRTDARVAFFSGTSNRCFLPDSQARTFDYFNGHRRDFHSLHFLAGYGHLDVFMGQDASSDVFPVMLSELERPH
jgi:pimeloyl-ACP methyl ester carboxylesterase